MGKFDSLLIVSDFDGTLTGSDGKIPQRNIDAIKYFIREGGKFTVSTGRTLKGFHNYTPELINAPVLLGNGAFAYDYKENRNVFVNGIGVENFNVLNKIIEDNPDIGIEFYSASHKTLVINPDEQSFRHFRGLKISDFEIIEKLEVDMFPFVKIMLSVNEKTFRVQKYLQENNIGTMKYIPCTGSYVEILSETAGKGNSLYTLGEITGVEFADIFVAGDGSNDTDMLSQTKNSFCPKNGNALAIKCAKHIACSNDEGVIGYIVAYIENKRI